VRDVQSKDAELTPALHEYIVARATDRDGVLRKVEEDTDALGGIAIMQTSVEQAALLEMLVRLTGARRAIEVGTFTGYGAIRVARGLPADGTLLCCEVDEGWAEIATRNIEAAGLSARVEVRLGPALDTLRALPQTAAFDFAYLDADKTGYPDYYEELVLRLTPNGLLAIDNVLMGGRVLDPPADDDGARAMAALNDRIPDDARVDSVMLGMGDGLTLVRKR
jgi:caffeoyl-CoA O-methyltransferase